MTTKKMHCERCGAPAQVTILEGYRSGKPVRHYLCLSCADAAFDLYPGRCSNTLRPRLSWSGSLLFAGMVLTALGASADELGIHGQPGFGWSQQAGLAVGALLLLVGCLARIDVVAIAGAGLFGLSALADFLGPLGSPGIGLKQGGAIAVGLVLLMAGFASRRRRLKAGRELQQVHMVDFGTVS